MYCHLTEALQEASQYDSPTLVIKKDELPEVTYQYIVSVKPIPKKEPAPPFMYGWIIGCDNDIFYTTQIEIEKALSIDEKHMT